MKGTESIPPLVGQHEPCLALLSFMKDFKDVTTTVVEDNARIHSSQSYFRIEVTANASFGSIAWCPQNNSVVGFAKSNKDRWGILNKSDGSLRSSSAASLHFQQLEERKSFDGIERLKIPNRQGSINGCQWSSSLSSTQDSSWNSKSEISDRQRILSKHAKLALSRVQPSLGGGDVSSPEMNLPPCAPRRFLSPCVSQSSSPLQEEEQVDDCPLVPPNRTSSVSSPVELDEEWEQSSYGSMSLQSPAPEFCIPLEVRRNPPRRQYSDDTLTSNDSTLSFRRKAPMHTNSFELTHRRSRVRRRVRKRRAIKMTPEDLKSRIFDILLTEDDDNQSSNSFTEDEESLISDDELFYPPRKTGSMHQIHIVTKHAALRHVASQQA